MGVEIDPGALISHFLVEDLMEIITMHLKFGLFFWGVHILRYP